MGKQANIFSLVSPAKTPRSAFNLSYEKKYTCDMGQLIPIMCDEAVPGDVWEIGQSAVCRSQPLMAALMHNLKLKTYYFFVPYRLLDTDWEEFITRGADGDQIITLPTWTPTGADLSAQENKLWDYLGFPIDAAAEITGSEPLDYPRRAYNTVWNEWFRDENLQTEIALTNEDILRKAWPKDYFTSALPWQQKGTAAILPVSGSVTFDLQNQTGTGAAGGAQIYGLGYAPGGDPTGLHTGSPILISGTSVLANMSDTDSTTALTRISQELSDNNVIAAQSVSINDLRLAFQVQVWMERNARAGNRYVEFLASHFPAFPKDDRLQRTL